MTKNWNFSLGHYHDRKADTQKETVDLHPISPAKPGAFDKAPGKALAPAGATSREVLDDDIPF